MSNPTATGEWTEKSVAMLYANPNRVNGWQFIAEAHNTALAAERGATDDAIKIIGKLQKQLAAERQKVQNWLDSLCFESLDAVIEELDERMAAMNERQRQINELREQLAAEREKHKTLTHAFESERELRKRYEDENKTFRAAQKACEDCDGLTMAEVQQLREQLAAEREKRKEDSIIYEKLADALDAKCQTLVDALKEAREVIAEEYGATVTAQSPFINRIDAALAQVRKQ